MKREQISEECLVTLNGQPQRADVVVFDNSAKAIILAECKAPEVKISQDTFDQAVRYNSVVKARYIILTNGITHHCYELSQGEYHPMESFPRV